MTIMNDALHAYYGLLRTDFYAFVVRSFKELHPDTPFLGNWHLEVICCELEQTRLGNKRRQIINLPPRYLKSHIVSVAWPAWLLGHNPSAKIIVVSYAQDLADKHARECRTLMLSPFYKRLFPKTSLSSGKQAVAEFETTAGGHRLSTSVGGVLTGRGADYIVLDDPTKPTEALSDALRNSVNEWYANTLYSRLNDKRRGVIAIVTQRLHEDDLVGYVLAQPGGWNVVRFPAIAEEEEDFTFETADGVQRVHRNVGDALHPERESLDDLQALRSTMGEFNFAGQYQQSPAPQGGGLIKADWFKSYSAESKPAAFTQIVQSWDTANKPNAFNDYSVCTTWGLKNKDIYLLDVFRERLEYPDLKRAVRRLREAFRPKVILIEDKSSGTQLIQEFKAERMYEVKQITPQGDKKVRCNAQTPMIENGLVYVPERAPWLDIFIHELTTFPASKYDDQVDSTTQALEYIASLAWVVGQGWLDYIRQQAEKAQAEVQNRKPRSILADYD